MMHKIFVAPQVKPSQAAPMEARRAASSAKWQAQGACGASGAFR